MSVDPADLLNTTLDDRTDTGTGAWAVGAVTEIVSATRVKVTVRGGTKTLPRLAGYTPTVGDTALIACVPGAWCLIGKFAT
ncbi:hypothetical protein [Pseudonocardia sp. WMMC193]|uniref:hypothetical protein n=1 Tax=Pseudonocardia sp. WMMC193 TaxID=2911965 RepID=UPI001F1FCADC|nr:hypothetical protein [Pseudonocardia sp. WMMC193]MCF7550963.1 hypothetical protein [Pseudonocardia sp. WMMC193]